jgi:hypothetical protein
MESKLSFSQENFDKLLESNAVLAGALQGVINSCAHPAIAIRCVMVDLTPIRKALKKNNELLEVDVTQKP